METHTNCGRHPAMTALFIAQLLVAFATPALAATPTPDPRWLPWIGCWAPTAATADVAPALAATQRVCIMPAEGTLGVDVVSVVGGEIVSRVRVEANGERRPVNREGCEGWETARWSEAGGRVYLRSEVTCAGGIDRVSTGVIAIASPSDWVDVEVVNVRDQRSTRVVRYRSAPDTIAVDREIAASLPNQEMARRAARMSAAALPTIADVIEASRHVEPATVEAWLLQRMPRFVVEVDELRRLAAARVPEAVIDLVVALSRPEMFQERLAPRGYTVVRLETPRPRVIAVEQTYATEDVTAPPTVYIDGGGSYGSRSSHRGRCDRCGSDSYYYDYDSYYYDPTPYGYYYYPYWPYGSYPLYPYRPKPKPQEPPARPPVIVHGPTYPKPTPTQPPPPAPDQVNGRAINGVGYTRPSSPTAESPATRSAPRGTASQGSPPEASPPRRAMPRPESAPSAPRPAVSQPESRPAAPTTASPRPAPPPAPESKPKAAPAAEQKPDAPPPRTAKPKPPGEAESSERS